MNPAQFQLAGSPAVRIGSLRVAGLCVIAALLCPLIPFVPANYLFLYVVVLSMALCLIVPLWYSMSRGDLDWFAPVHVIGVLYFFYFGLGSLGTVHDPKAAAYDRYIPPHIPIAAFYCLLGYLAVLTAYYGPWFRKPAVPSVREKPVGASLLLVIGLLGLTGLLARANLQHTFRPGSGLNVFVSTAAQLWPLFVFAWVLGWQLHFSRQITRAQRVVLFGILAPGVLLVMFLTYGNKSMSMMLVCLPILARWYVKRTIPWVLIIVLLLILVFVVFPLYNTYRWFDRNASHASRVSMSYDAVANWNSKTYFDNSIGTFIGRMAVINSVAIVVRDVGRWQPYAKGDSILLPTVAYFIPRLLWPDKPTSIDQLEFGRRFRVTNYFTREVHIAPTWPGELYWNFGAPGIVFGLALAAVGVRLLYRRYIETASGPVPTAIWIMLLSELLLLLEAPIAPGVSEIVRSAIVVEVVRTIALQYGFVVREPIDA